MLSFQFIYIYWGQTGMSLERLVTLVLLLVYRGCHGRDRMVVLLVSWFHKYLCNLCQSPLSCEFESCSGEVSLIQQYVIKFVSELQQVHGFLRVLRFPPPVKLPTTI
jgi:hypothetical protein